MTSYRLEIDDKKWNKFKDTLSKNQTINQVIENWIDQRIEEDQ
jgi:lauroyl/myristoyl acyltransferase